MKECQSEGNTEGALKQDVINVKSFKLIFASEAEKINDLDPGSLTIDLHTVPDKLYNPFCNNVSFLLYTVTIM